MSIPRKRFMSSIKAAEFDDDTLDRADNAYRAEYDRWCWRRRISATDLEVYRMNLFDIVRNTSPKGDKISEEYQEIIKLTKRECRDSDGAECWLHTLRGRAAMRAALGAL